MRCKPKYQQGFTLVEVVVALAIAALLAVALYKSYDLFAGHASCQEVKLGAQQKARAAASLMEKEMLLIGFMVPPGVDPIEPVLDLDLDPELYPELYPEGEAGPDEAPVLRLDPASLTFRYFDRADGKKLRVSYFARDTEFVRDLCVIDVQNDDGRWDACLDGQRDETLIDDLASLDFRYFDARGIVAVNEDDVRFIRASIEVLGTEKCRGQAEPPRSNVTIEVRPRNL